MLLGLKYFCKIVMTITKYISDPEKRILTIFCLQQQSKRCSSIIDSFRFLLNHVTFQYKHLLPLPCRWHTTAKLWCWQFALKSWDNFCFKCKDNETSRLIAQNYLECNSGTSVVDSKKLKIRAINIFCNRTRGLLLSY